MSVPYLPGFDSSKMKPLKSKYLAVQDLLNLLKRQVGKIALIASVGPIVSLLLGMCFIQDTEVWKSEKKTKNKKPSFGVVYTHLWKGLRMKPEVYKPFAIVNLAIIIRSSTGAIVITNYAISVITATGIKTDPYLVAIGLSIFCVLGSFTASLLCKFFKRKNILIAVSIIKTFTMIGICILQYGVTWPRGVLEALLVLYMSWSYIFDSINRSVVGELFPTDVRGVCSSVSQFVTSICYAMMLFLYPLYKSWFGIRVTMLIYLVACVGCIPLALYVIPHTDDMTLDEIVGMFKVETKKTAPLDEEVPLQDQEEKKIEINK